MTIVGLALVAVVAAAQRRVIVSPEVHPDHTVTFRFVDPGASKVEVGVEGRDNVPMSKDADGVWTYTTDPLPPDIYGYSFSADGQVRLDPQNPSQIKPNLIYSGNMVLVPGNPPELWEHQNVPHGTVHHEFYHSGIIGDDRDYFVYTPPGYKPTARTRYPVMCLLHGFSDMANGWTSVGKMNDILDNLISQGKATPMIVVMTLGYGIPNFNGTGQGMGTRSYDNFRDALLKEVLPAVESDYRVKAGKANRAIAGLSMGGAETLYVGLNNLDKFSYVGAFSSGGLRGDLDAAFPGFNGTTANSSLKVLMVSCGVDDGLIKFNRDLVTWLKGKGTNVQQVETPGRHAWMVWRRNLIQFSQELFK